MPLTKLDKDIKSFSARDMTSFGNYMVSIERRNRYKRIRFKGISLKERLSQVNQADLYNWLAGKEAEQEIPAG